jgi:hypothetical protein
MMVVVNSKNVTEIAVCVDCLLVIVGAEEITDENGVDISERQVAAMTAVWGVDMSRMVVSSDDGTWFSWSPCDGCGSTLGGAREKAVVLPA